MNTELWLAIIGITGTLLASIIGYIFQHSASNRERKWARETEQRTVRREALSRRLEIVEETANLMNFMIGVIETQQMDEVVFCDDDMIKEKNKRIEYISAQAWSIVEASGSSELKESFQAVASAYWEGVSPTYLKPEKIKASTIGIVNLVKIIDSMKERI